MEPITDDYVADILRKDAEKKNSNNRYLTSGLGSLLSGGRSRPRSDAPKPNTRFLKHIVKEADTHNAALRKKEEEDSRQRLKSLKREREREREKSHRKRSPEGGREKRHRNEFLAHLRRDDRGVDGEDRKKRHRSRRDDDDKRRSRSPRKDRSRSPDPGRRHKRRRSDDLENIKGYAERRHAKPEPRSRRDHRPTSEDVPAESSNIGYLKPVDDDSDSDPLESIIGPKTTPKIRPRGRGANNTSSMDTRFDPNYDPSMDVGRDLNNADDDDWGMALEALKDRAKWRKSGAERLKAAGFADEEIAKWESGGGSKGSGRLDGEEKDIADVRWTKKGEDREWDRGKVMEEDHVELRPEWGRLKGT